jgi:hypothetical protein
MLRPPAKSLDYVHISAVTDRLPEEASAWSFEALILMTIMKFRSVRLRV